MKRIDNEIYLSVREVAYEVDRSPATMFNLLKIDKLIKEEGREGFLPNTTRINNIQHFKLSDIKVIKSGIANLKRGDLKEYRKHLTSYEKLKRQNEELKEKLVIYVELSKT
ncbi:hypothetical protein [Psychrobacillus sp. FSL K6-1415]|uniref:hypothetical protein n=1 Tax=Psychrobacillus sp. FSL K6-1415 TaxID=2921544 RepID=UPI0030FA6DA7